MESTRLPVSSTFTTVDLRRSQTDMSEESFVTAASQVPFSEKYSALMGPDMSKVAALVPLLTSNILIWPSAPPAARR